MWELINIPRPNVDAFNFSHLVVKVVFLDGFPNGHRIERTL